jgi:PAT family beta-lactamase induction signal transducer AmpG
MGFSSGIPLALTGATLQAWMKNEKVDLTLIGLFSLVGMPYALKFLWSPLMDRFIPPFLGRRRGWILICQLLLVVAIAVLGFSRPQASPGLTAALAFLVAFFSSSQDIVVDAYKTDLLPRDEVGPGAAFNMLGYRVAMLVSGSLALILADHLSWQLVYLTMSATMLLGVVATFLSPEPAIHVHAPRTLADAVVLPLVEYFKRRGAVEILFFIVFYKLDAVIASALMTPFLMDLGFTKTDIGTVIKGFGLIATLVGTMAGGALMMRLGMLRSLWTFGLAQGLAGLSFLTLAHLGHNYPMMVVAISVENVCSGMGTAAFAAFLMSICDKRFTATQYALLTSLMAVTRVIGGAPTGYVAKTFGWENYFIFSIVAMIPGLLILLRFNRWVQPEVADG